MPKKALGEKMDGRAPRTPAAKVAPRREPKAKADAPSSTAWQGQGAERIDDADKLKTQVFLLDNDTYAKVRSAADALEARRKRDDGKVNVPGGGVTKKRVTPSTLARLALAEYLAKYAGDFGD